MPRKTFAGHRERELRGKGAAASMDGRRAGLECKMELRCALALRRHRAAEDGGAPEPVAELVHVEEREVEGQVAEQLLEDLEDGPARETHKAGPE